MSDMEIRKATRKKAKLRLGISAPTGAGKTFSSLLIASGISQKVVAIDTENSSAELYSEDEDIKRALPNGYDTLILHAPYTPSRYVQAIEACERAGYEVIIIDSLTHAWAGVGGSLDKQGKETDKTGNSYTAWRKVTPDHDALVNKLLQSTSHIIATMRSKTEYVQEKNEQGKTVVRKVGMAPIMRDGIAFEFTVFAEMDQENFMSSSKDRTRIFKDTYVKPTKETGEKLLAWLNSGEEVKPTFDWKGWATHFADEVKSCDDADSIVALAISEEANLKKLQKELPDYHQRLMQLIAERETLLQKGAA